MNEADFGAMKPVLEITEKIAQRVNSFVNDKESGIPEMKRQLEESGFQARVETSVTLSQNLTKNVLGEAGMDFDLLLTELDEPDSDELAAASSMGFSLEEVRGMKAERKKAAEKALSDGIRQISSQLTKRVRNWICGFLAHNFPNLNVDFPENQPLADDSYWQTKVDEIIKASLQSQDSIHILSRILGNMMRLKDIREHPGA
ncbi:MAG: hypothetical protein WD898_00990 [Candidatus Paceibacterota bacterium]